MTWRAQASGGGERFRAHVQSEIMVLKERKERVSWHSTWLNQSLHVDFGTLVFLPSDDLDVASDAYFAHRIIRNDGLELPESPIMKLQMVFTRASLENHPLSLAVTRLTERPLASGQQ